MLKIRNNSQAILLIGILSALVFIPFIGNCPLFDWDEVNFAECAREMIVSGNYSEVQLNYQLFWEKPPFFIWMQALSMQVFGVNEFAARFPNAICGIASLISLFYMGKKYHSAQFGFVWVLLYASTLLPHLYFKSGIIDPWFNLFIFLALYQCFIFLTKNKTRSLFIHAVMAGVFLGLAVLTKGPTALVILGITILVYLFWCKQLRLLFTLRFLVFALTTLVVSGSWFMVEWLNGNKHIIQEFIEYQIRLFETGDSGHGGSYAYHFIVLLLGCFPASFLFILAYLKRSELNPELRNYRKLMLSLFWVVLIIFTIVQTKIIHYSSLCYYPLTFIAALGIIQVRTMKFNFVSGFFYFVMTFVVSVSFILLCSFPFIKPYILKSGMIKDEFAVQNLEANVAWTGYEFLIGFMFLLGCIFIFYSISKQNIRLFYYGTAINIIFLSATIYIMAPKIEGYTQHATVEFYKKCAHQKCYIETRGFKSYTYLFYSERKPDDFKNPDQIKYINAQLDEMEKNGHSRLQSYALANLLWLENGKIDRVTYIVTKSIEEKDNNINKNLTKLYNLNGYSFFVRLPDRTAK